MYNCNSFPSRGPWPRWNRYEFSCCTRKRSMTNSLGEIDQTRLHQGEYIELVLVSIFIFTAELDFDKLTCWNGSRLQQRAHDRVGIGLHAQPYTRKWNFTNPHMKYEIRVDELTIVCMQTMHRTVFSNDQIWNAGMGLGRPTRSTLHLPHNSKILLMTNGINDNDEWRWVSEWGRGMVGWAAGIVFSDTRGWYPKSHCHIDSL